MRFRDPHLPLPERVADLLGRLTVAEKIALLHQHQAPIERLGVGAFRTGTEALHGLAWLGEATVFPQAVGLGATWDLDLVQRVGDAVGDEVRASHHKDPTRAGLNVWAPVVNPLRDPRWGRNEEGYSEDSWLTGLLGKAYAQGLRGDHPRYLKTAPTLKHFLGYNNETDRCTSSSNLGPRVLHEYELPAYRPAIASGAAVAVMASYNLVNGRPAHVTPHLNDALRSWTDDEVFVVSDAYAPSNLADPRLQAYFPDHAASHAASLKAGVDSFTDQGEDTQPTLDRLHEALQRGLISEADIDRAASRALALRIRLGEFDPAQANPYTQLGPDTINCPAHQALSRETAQRSIVLLKREGDLLPLDPAQAGRIAVIGQLGDQLMADWYSGTFAYRSTILNGLSERVSAEVTFTEGVDRIRLHLPGGPCDVDVFDWGNDVLALRSTHTGGYLSLHDGVLSFDSPGPHGWEVHETFRLIPQTDGTHALHHELTKTVVALCQIEVLHLGTEKAAEAATAADTVILALGNHPLVNGRETEDRQDLALPRAQQRLLQAVYEANQRTVLVVTSSYPYAIGWADEHLPAIIWSSHGGQEYGRALADVLFGDAEPAGRLPQTWYSSHSELPDLLDYDIITNDATYLYHRGTPLYPFGHGLTWAEFDYRNLTLSQSTADATTRVSVSVEVTNTGTRPVTEVVQLYTHQQRSRVKQPLRQLRGFTRVALDPGQTRAVTIDLDVADLAFWDVTSGRFVVEAARHKVMVGRSATDIRACTTLLVEGERLGPRRVTGALAAVDHDEGFGIALTDASPESGDAVMATENGAWICFGTTDLTGFSTVTVTASGSAGWITLRAGDPVDGEVLASLAVAGNPRYQYRAVSAPLTGAPLDRLYLVCDTPGIVVLAIGFGTS
ncbi:beta-glucosidase-like glycosyl hydrolase [Rhizocola hellebori]|uniref:Exo-alpha-(1->6)-L-arabinopyranosidase n=1 Tax=Rhizocola hellebori TaxID=1392758 RepID=A0A8J3QJP8_9ACTN|nr:glycoside hydrolase family 3 protein [Rhizocola hellebori]GIH10985.1 beta-glucosidase-like glycosyl hydrolase [Rhizocola hellebori]